MEKFSELDLGSTILSIAVAAGFVACGFVILRLILEALKSLISKTSAGPVAQNSTAKVKNKQKGF